MNNNERIVAALEMIAEQLRLQRLQRMAYEHGGAPKWTYQTLEMRELVSFLEERAPELLAANEKKEMKWLERMASVAEMPGEQQEGK